MTIVGTSLLAALCGIDDFNGIEDFVEMHLDSLKGYFNFPHGPASHDTYQRLWDSLCPRQFKACFTDFIASLEKLSSDVISLDGKTIRHSGADKALHIVSAWYHANKMVFCQEKVHEKSNEITAIPKVLSLLDLRGKMITIDAMRAQRSICEQIIKGQGEYVIGLKGNQGSLHKDVQMYLRLATFTYEVQPYSANLRIGKNCKSKRCCDERISTNYLRRKKLNRPLFKRGLIPASYRPGIEPSSVNHITRGVT